MVFLHVEYITVIVGLLPFWFRNGYSGRRIGEIGKCEDQVLDVLISKAPPLLYRR